MIAVVSYGVCNIGSILNMLKRIGANATSACTPAAIVEADKIVLPGIGAYDTGMSALASFDLIEPLRIAAGRGTPILGICLGMQLLAGGSEEGVLPGLGLIDGRCVRFRNLGNPPLRVPHMGWNTIVPTRPSVLFRTMDEHARFYFVHSYHLECADPEDVLATARYGNEFTAMVNRGTVWGAQFHPEKSHRYGMALLDGFSSL